MLIEFSILRGSIKHLVQIPHENLRQETVLQVEYLRITPRSK